MGTPESQGLSSRALAEAVRVASSGGAHIHSLLVIRNGIVVLDATFYPFQPGRRHDIASNTKSVTSLLAGAAIQRGVIPGLDENLIAMMHDTSVTDPRKKRITIGDLLAMRSGLSCGKHDEQDLDAMRATHDWVQAALAIPMADEPDARMSYCSPNYHLVSYALQRRTGESLMSFADKALFRPLGIRDYVWPSDPMGVTHGWGDLQLPPRDLAKIGLLALHDGIWEGRRLLPSGWISRTTTSLSRYNADNFYGYGWWTHPSSPRGLYEGIGRGGQRLSIWPEKGIIVVITGGGFDPSVVGGMLVSSLRADGAITPDSAGFDSLRGALATAERGPAPQPADTVPEAIQRVSGRTFSFGQNGFGLRTLRFTAGRDVAAIRMEMNDRVLNLPIGLDGRYRFSADSIDGIAPAARGTTTANGIDIDLNLVGKINRYQMDVRVDRDGITVSVAELTGSFRMTAVGTLVR